MDPVVQHVGRVGIVSIRLPGWPAAPHGNFPLYRQAFHLPWDVDGVEQIPHFVEEKIHDIIHAAGWDALGKLSHVDHGDPLHVHQIAVGRVRQHVRGGVGSEVHSQCPV